MRKLGVLLALTIAACSDPGPSGPDGFGVTVEGRIESATGAPVAGWQIRPVMWMNADCTGGGYTPDARAVSKPDGTFVLHVPSFRAEPVCLGLISNDTTSGVPYANARSSSWAQATARKWPFEIVQLVITLPP